MLPAVGSYNIYAWVEGIANGVSLNADIVVPGPGPPPDFPVTGTKTDKPMHWIVLPTCPPSNKFTIVLASNSAWKLAVKDNLLWATAKNDHTEFSAESVGSGNWIVGVGDGGLVLKLEEVNAQVKAAAPDSSKKELFSFYS